MGSQGMSRKGRSHLPKVGTPKDERYVQRRRREDLVNFGRHRRFAGASVLVWVAIAVLAVLGLVGWLALT